MGLAHSRMLIHELLDKDPEIVPQEAPLIFLGSKSAMCMSNNGKDTKHKRHIARRIRLVRNGEKFNMNKIDQCQGGMKLAYIATNNVEEHDLTPRMKYSMVRLDN